jgi:hypothetical protein
MKQLTEGIHDASVKEHFLVNCHFQHQVANMHSGKSTNILFIFRNTTRLD